MLTMMSRSAAPYVCGRIMGARVQRGRRQGQVAARQVKCANPERLLQQNRLEPLLQLWGQMGGAHEEASAGVPTQNGVVCPRRTEGFCFLVSSHGLPKHLVRHGARS